MSYRKIKVEGDDYRYVTGKEFTKIQILKCFEWVRYDVIRNSEIGNPKECTIPQEYFITPKNISNFIKGEGVPVLRCEQHNFSTLEVTYDPYDAEVNQLIVYTINCPECINNSAADI